ncbi:hypothetical protein D8M04_18895 [Oceanobacillus piezotolerans]|uniref:Tetratricopeptide repeat protein n=1 Tax=Oceanobacillus piezotolerans TaxID=2448030 RepID=A0A498D653_9BACI|nr:hypothetical protein [Oceanobacillus piezotolerans]RLL40614.1 hypothetical protein D8M04_18895 [Oceanobacillus piezotolerans]
MEINDTHMKEYEKGKRFLKKGTDGDKDAVHSAYEIFLKLRKAYPDHALIEAYYGSTLALLSRDADETLEKADKAQTALDALNHAISMDSNHKDIRKLRAKVCMRLPDSYFRASQTAIEDLSFLLDRYKDDPSYLTNKEVTEIKKDLRTAYKNVEELGDVDTEMQQQSNHASVKNFETLMEQDIPSHKDNMENNEKAGQEFNNGKNLKKFEEGKIYLKKAANGDKDAVNTAHEIFLKLRKAEPSNALYEAYYGMTMMLIARNKKIPLSRLKESIAGMKILDGAVRAAPHDSRIRLLRGRAASRLPEEYFHRAKTVIEDYTFLIEREMQKEGFLRTEEYLQVIYQLGEAYSRIGQNQAAVMCWKRLMNETQDPDFLRLLTLKMKSLEGKPAVEHNAIPESPVSILIRRSVHFAGSEIKRILEDKNFQ